MAVALRQGSEVQVQVLYIYSSSTKYGDHLVVPKRVACLFQKTTLIGRRDNIYNTKIGVSLYVN